MTDPLRRDQDPAVATLWSLMEAYSEARSTTPGDHRNWLIYAVKPLTNTQAPPTPQQLEVVAYDVASETPHHMTITIEPTKPRS